MKYNPTQHQRRSIRLKGYDYASSGAYFITICSHQRHCLFGEIVDGEMRLNALGQLVHASWQRLPLHFPNLSLDAFVVMPNHVHGILVLTNQPGRGAALGQNIMNQPRRGAALGQGLEDLTEDSCPNATPTNDPSEPDVALGQNIITTPTPNPSKPGVALGQNIIDKSKEPLPNAAPLPPRLISGSVGAIVLNFKSVTTRSKNRLQRSPGVPMWQRNYYEHIIRNDEALHQIRQYIHNNPLTWQEDQLHPDVRSKW